MPIENAKTASPIKVGARIKKGFFFGTAGCLFFGLISTLLLMAGESEMGTNSVVWKFSVLGSLSTVFLNTGNGHGVFMVLAFLTVPIMLWGIGILVQTILVMIYYPIKIERKTGKPVLMKNW